jgi:hypothetical protein
VLAHVAHYDHAVGEWIGIRPAVDHVVTFARACATLGCEAGSTITPEGAPQRV